MGALRATRWRVLQLLVLFLAGAGLVLAEEYTPAAGIEAQDPLMFVVGVVLVGYAVLAAAAELVLGLWEVAASERRS